MILSAQNKYDVLCGRTTVSCPLSTMTFKPDVTMLPGETHQPSMNELFICSGKFLL